MWAPCKVFCTRPRSLTTRKQAPMMHADVQWFFRCRCDLELAEGGRYPGLYILTAHANPAVRALVRCAADSSSFVIQPILTVQQAVLLKRVTSSSSIRRHDIGCISDSSAQNGISDRMHMSALLAQVASDVERLGPFESAADLEQIMCVLERWTRLLQFDLFHSQAAPEGQRKMCVAQKCSCALPDCTTAAVDGTFRGCTSRTARLMHCISSIFRTAVLQRPRCLQVCCIRLHLIAGAAPPAGMCSREFHCGSRCVASSHACSIRPCRQRFRHSRSCAT